MKKIKSFPLSIKRPSLALLAELLIIFFPVVIVFLNPEYLYYRDYVYPFAVIMLIYFSFRSGLSLRDLGVNLRNSLKGMNYYLVALLMFFPILTLSFIYNKSAFMVQAYINDPNPRPFYMVLILYPIFSVTIQELVFRGYYYNRFKQVLKNIPLAILFTSALFALVHVPFVNFYFILGSFILGIILNLGFSKSNNLLLPIVTHAFIGIYYFYLVRLVS